ncbi:GNAT family N-acetyltransferase [Clostridioides difficile]
MVIHRMAVNPNFRKTGIASKLVDFAEKLAAENMYQSILCCYTILY